VLVKWQNNRRPDSAWFVKHPNRKQSVGAASTPSSSSSLTAVACPPIVGRMVGGIAIVIRETEKKGQHAEPTDMIRLKDDGSGWWCGGS
jgi:hypothetical protein